MKLNFISAALVNLWLAGWVLAALWAGLKAREEAAEAHAKSGPNKPRACRVDN